MRKVEPRLREVASIESGMVAEIKCRIQLPGNRTPTQPHVHSEGAMFIVIDHDETYTEDPALWDTFLMGAKARGHTVICCTYRLADQLANTDVEANMGKHGIPVIYAAEYPNKWDAVAAAGYIPENAIWIDDRPHIITTHYSIAYGTR